MVLPCNAVDKINKIVITKTCTHYMFLFYTYIPPIYTGHLKLFFSKNSNRSVRRDFIAFKYQTPEHLNIVKINWNDTGLINVLVDLLVIAI